MIVTKAKEYAYKKHKGQYRKGKTVPFITHLERASTIASNITDDKEIIAATWLHDVVEDTDATLEEIEELFGKRVASLVELESEDKREGIDEKESWRVRKEEQIESLKNVADKDVYIIALSDKLANISEMYEDLKTTPKEEFWSRFNNSNVDHQFWYYNSFYEIVKNHELIKGTDEIKLFRDLIKKVFDK